jgi:hypothetical protein
MVLRAQELDQRVGIVLVTIALRHHLADEDGVRFERNCARGKLHVFDLGAEVVRFETLVALEPLVAGVPFVVENGVDSDGVRVAAGARPDHDDPASQPFRDAFLDLVVGEGMGLELRDFEYVYPAAASSIVVTSGSASPCASAKRLAPSRALAEGGRGSTNDICTMPSPSRSP